MGIDFDTYQFEAHTTAQYPHAESPVGSKENYQALAYVSLGLTGEAGEIANKVKKLLRGDIEKFPVAIQGDVNKERYDAIRAELGDVLWYAAEMANVLGVKLGDVAVANLRKLNNRAARGNIKGDGDQR